MGTYATKPAPKKPAPTIDANAKAPAPKPKPPVAPAPPMPAGPATYEPDRLATRLLQQALERGERALAVYTADREGQVMVASEEVTAFVRELVEISSDPDIAWETHAEPLANLALLIDRLTSVLAKDGLALSAPLTAAYAQLAFRVPPEVLGAVPGRDPAKPLDETGQLELARHAIGAARKHLATLPVLDPKHAQAQAAAFCKPLKLHLAIASDAADAVRDRRARRTLKPDVEAVSLAMDELAESLGMKPEIPWDVSFASAFDAENALRAELGLARRTRPYTGNVDPAAAVQQVRSIANGASTDMRGVRWTDPELAVAAIQRGVDGVFQRQLAAIVDLESSLLREDPVPAKSWADILLEIGANVALSAVAGALGAAVSRLVSTRLEALQIGLNVSPATLGLLSKDERELVTSEVLSRGVLARAVVVDSLKDGTKEMFKSLARLATSKHVIPNGKDALSDFARAHREKLWFAKEQAGLAVLHLSPALKQADLDTLNVLAYTLGTAMPQVAHDAQYDHSMREWQNFKARLSAGPASVQMGKVTDRDADIRDDHTPGVVEVGLAFSADRTVTRRSLRLNGAEPAARAHFRRLAIPLGEAGLNQRFDVLVLARGNSETLVFGIAPDRGLVVESLTRREWRLLRMLAEYQPATLENVNRALRGEFDATTDAAALRVLYGIVREAASYSTSSLED